MSEPGIAIDGSSECSNGFDCGFGGAGRAVEFVGYSKTFCDTEIVAVLDSGALVLKETPFYPKVGDSRGIGVN